MKKSKIAMSLILMPALVWAGGAGGGTTGCSSTGSTPPSPNLPVTVTGVQATTSSPTTFSLKLSGVAAGLDLTNATYGVWCANPAGFVPGSIVKGSALFDATGSATYTVYNSYAYSTYSAGANTGFPGKIVDGTTMLTLSQEWNAVNYILNNLSGTPADIQGAIWQLLHPTDGVSYITGPGTDSGSKALYDAAVANGTSFMPAVGQLSAVILVPTTPSGSPEPYQGVLVPITVKGPGCTGVSSASLTKTASVSVANAFQAVTYTYVVKNTGTTTLTNLVIVDDNGTPSYPGDDVTVGTAASLAPGLSLTFTSTVYLPIKLFYQSGSSAAWDTLIPQIPASPSNALCLTYLIDTDVSDNTYGSGASSGWKGVGGHSFSQVLGNYAEFALYDSLGNLVSDFDADYLSHVGVSSTSPSGYGSAGLHGSPIYGGTSSIQSITSILADTLNGYSKFYGDTTNSPVGDSNWQCTAGYKVTVSKGIFGWFGMGSVSVKKNCLNVAESPFCGTPKSTTYTPSPITTKVTGTAYLCASVLNCCSTIVHAKASTCVTLNGASQPTCSSASLHQCQTPKCACTCPQCLAGNHASCSLVGCHDWVCQSLNCTHNTISCVWGTFTW